MFYYNKCPCVNVNLLVSSIPSLTEHFVLRVRKPLVCRKRGTFGPTVLGDYTARNRARNKPPRRACPCVISQKVMDRFGRNSVDGFGCVTRINSIDFGEDPDLNLRIFKVIFQPLRDMAKK